ncbi:hypothetical protein CTAYLR_006865 [Chrysophaeum taylorii]|uniref:Major facilitator superfamily (MFS) profile domain-containing protein n=1 Tax=Chrysophaeum taylorii TaxID=2483200 RepID=A0AAD7U565_9STRA|nr:hypothetical protein CTAYLR_006865 [Chrysophaeum taylorii]
MTWRLQSTILLFGGLRRVSGSSRQPSTAEVSVWRDPRVLCLCMSTGCMMLGHGVATPIVPMLSQSMDASASAVGLALSAFGVSRLALNVPVGIAADRFGRKACLVGGALINAVGMAASGFAPDMTWFTAARVIAGAGNSLYLGSAQVYLADIADSSRRGRFLGANHAALLAGVSVGPALGGLCAEAFGLRAPFVAVSVLAVASAATSAVLLGETRPVAEPRRKGEDDPPRDGWLSIVLDPRFASVGLAQFATFALRQGGRNLILALIASEVFEYSPADLGRLFGAMALVDLVAVAPAAALSDKVNDPRLIVFPSLMGTAMAVAFVGATAVEGAAFSHALFLAGVGCWSLSTACLGPTLPAYASELAPRRRAASISLFRSCGDLGFVVAPVVLGAIVDTAGPQIASAALAATVSASAFTFAAFGRAVDPVPAPAQTSPPRASPRLGSPTSLSPGRTPR